MSLESWFARVSTSTISRPVSSPASPPLVCQRPPYPILFPTTLVFNTLTCPAGTKKVTGNPTSPFDYVCSVCEPGTYNSNGTDVCYTCPEGAVCNGGSSLLAAQNYWQNPAFVADPQFFLCGSTHCCPEVGCDQNNTCIGLYGGNLCSSCPDGCYDWNDECLISCEIETGQWVVVTAVVVSFLFLAVYILIPKNRTYFLVDLVSPAWSLLPLFGVSMVATILTLWFRAPLLTRRPPLSPPSKQLFYYQVAGLLVESPTTIGAQLFGALHLNLEELTSATKPCVAPLDPFSKYMFIFLAPLVLFAELFFLRRGEILALPRRRFQGGEGRSSQAPALYQVSGPG